MNCTDCKHLGTKFRIGHRCHKLAGGREYRLYSAPEGCPPKLRAAPRDEHPRRELADVDGQMLEERRTPPDKARPGLWS